MAISEEKINTQLIVWLPTFSIAALVAAALIGAAIGQDYKVLFDKQEATDEERISTEARCISNAGRLSLSIKKNGELLRVSSDLSQDVTPQQVFSNISILLLSCDDYSLDYFCAGTGCAVKDKITADFKLN